MRIANNSSAVVVAEPRAIRVGANGEAELRRTSGAGGARPQHSATVTPEGVTQTGFRSFEMIV